MAITVVGSSPSFAQSFNNIISISNYTNKILIPNRGTIAIPTDSFGVNEDFSEAIVTFYVYDAGLVKTTDWTLSLSASTDCTVTVSNVLKTATISAIAEDTANFVVKASKTGESDLFRLITVYKAKAGVDGSSTPDSETIILDGSNHLKVANHTLYDNGSSYTNGLLIGPGSITTNSRDASSNFLVIQSEALTTSYLNGTDNVILIGSGTYLDQGLPTGATLFNDGVVIGQNLGTQCLQAPPYIISDFTVVGSANGGSWLAEVADGTCTLGVHPTNLIADSTAISMYKGAALDFESGTPNRDIHYLTKESTVISGSDTTVTLDLSEYTYTKNTVHVAAQTSGDTERYLGELHVSILDGSAVVNYTNTNETYQSTAFSGINALCSVTGGVLSVTLPDSTTNGYMQVMFEVKALL